MRILEELRKRLIYAAKMGILMITISVFSMILWPKDYLAAFVGASVSQVFLWITIALFGEEIKTWIIGPEPEPPEKSSSIELADLDDLEADINKP